VRKPSEALEVKLLDLFAGIGGFSLAAHWMGWETVAFVEKDDFAQKVLAKNFQGVPIFDDVRTFDGTGYRGTVDIVCGGFPCQDISTAGTGIGIEGERSSLWRELCRTISEIRPRYAVVENVSALLGRGMARVLGDLSAIGYDAEWRVFSACELGFPHPRERVFIIAYPSGKFSGCGVLDRYRDQESQRSDVPELRGSDWQRFAMVSDAHSLVSAWSNEYGQSPLIRVVDGIPDFVDGVRCYGNSIVPQIAFEIFKAIEAAEK
jgi:DNA (cytosine-5)-methyltransferase 1